MRADSVEDVSMYLVEEFEFLDLDYFLIKKRHQCIVGHG